MEQLNTGNQHWDRIADYATEPIIMDMSCIRYVRRIAADANGCLLQRI
jgi:hypothetical protein